MKEPYYIAIEGNIGAGKTTLATLLARALDARVILEQFADNPFLNEFYSNPERWAFTVEMAFMAERYQQLHDLLIEIDLFQPVFVSDYHPFKSKLFASVNLSEKEYFLYEHFFDMLFKKIRKPDLLIFLSAETNTLLKNIQQRGRWFEKKIEPEYLEKLSEAYKNFLKTHSTATLILKRESFDFLKNPEHLNLLVNIVEQKKIQGLMTATDPDELRAFLG
ncbi:hypothetical protein JCM31826_18070 [Thermaurantimonas aggregans]|uniref:Deoxynucleoside kinase domain-containing protein n=1 Tax=Thermaurantimonas aggregans TaxID=2173829 RepID=A0A401XMS5_9FLAO|nr:deoxynucleoside kinase [Thermaurantimonas aggregans]MCX8149380.1 deoxynucleoside kinase [Thermaurantimonas aggregans]GCD78325.1 hypothetical protein JCM31826_18070 [Thermaurantimonas aggregans]